MVPRVKLLTRIASVMIITGRAPGKQEVIVDFLVHSWRPYRVSTDPGVNRRLRVDDTVGPLGIRREWFPKGGGGCRRPVGTD